MYENDLFTGSSSLKDKTLCLTFDDGPGHTDMSLPAPGPRTVQIARYLNMLGIRATFFVVGKFATELPAVMQEVRELGHLIGNHTYDHMGLVDYAASKHDVVSQILKTDKLILSYVDGPLLYFRPPYGQWHPAVAHVLNADVEASTGHIGPIGWDIDGGDWYHWQQSIAPTHCAYRYMREIVNRGGKGVILMHDCTADLEAVKLGNRTFEMIQILIPKLLRQGYNFVRLDEIPEIAAKG